MNRISGAVLSKRIGTSRNRLSEIECGYLTSPIEEPDRISEATDEIVQARRQLAKLSADAFLSLIEVRLCIQVRL